MLTVYVEFGSPPEKSLTVIEPLKGAMQRVFCTDAISAAGVREMEIVRLALAVQLLASVTSRL